MKENPRRRTKSIDLEEDEAAEFLKSFEKLTAIDEEEDTENAKYTTEKPVVKPHSPAKTTSTASMNSSSTVEGEDSTVIATGVTNPWEGWEFSSK